jgi:hypothetical protein
MAISLVDFRRAFLDEFQELHWRQWTALGVASHVAAEKNWSLDLEALMTSTVMLRQSDPRLFHVAVEWVIVNIDLVNSPRLKRIQKLFGRREGEQFPPLIQPNAMERVNAALRRHGKKELPVVGVEKGVDRSHDSKGESDSMGFDARGVVTTAEVRNPSLQQLFLRRVFGINARPEILLYFLTHEAGNSLQIAREVFYDQKTVYRILENWGRAGLLERIPKGRRRNYSLQDKQAWVKLLKIRDESRGFLNWGRVFRVFAMVMQALHTPPWSEDAYLFSSFFRDIHGELSVVFSLLDMVVPDPGVYPGEEFFSPMAEEILSLFQKLR